MNQSSLSQSFAELVHTLTVHMVIISSYILLIINTVQNCEVFSIYMLIRDECTIRQPYS